MRKPIQIQVTYVPEGNGCAPALIQTVLCDDGTIWHKEVTAKKWAQVADIPQSAPEGGGEA